MIAKSSSSRNAAAPPAEIRAAAEAPLAVAAPAVSEAVRFHSAWHALLASGEVITFEELQLELVLAAWESNERNQVRTAKFLNISRNVVRTYLKKAGVL